MKIEINKIQLDIRELLSYIFFSLMFMLKGLGFYDGQEVYKILLLLSVGFLGLKLVIDRYNIIEFAFTIGLLVLGGVTYITSTDKGFLICMLMIVAAKDVSVKRLSKVILYVWSISFSLLFFISIIRINSVATSMQRKNIVGAVLRYYMGYPHPNVLHISFFLLVVLWIYVNWERVTIKSLLILTFINVLIFFYSYSFTGTLVTFLFIVMTYLVTKFECNKTEVSLLYYACILIPLLSLFIPILSIIDVDGKIDAFFNNRLHLSTQYLTGEYIHWFGNRLDVIMDEINTLDNSYLYLLIVYGIIPFFILYFLYIIYLKNLFKYGKVAELTVTLFMFLGGVTEPYLFNTSFKNVTLILLGNVIYSILFERGSNLVRGYSKNIAIKSILIKGSNIIIKQSKKIIMVIFSLVVAYFGSVYIESSNVLLDKYRGGSYPELLFYDGLRCFLTLYIIIFGILYASFSVFKRSNTNNN